MDLFREDKLTVYFARKRQAMQQHIEKHSYKYMAEHNLADIIDDCIASFRFEPIELQTEDISRRVVKEITITRTFRSSFYIEMQAVEEPGIRVEFYYPFTGDAHLFSCQASRMSYSPYPKAEVIGDALVFVYDIALSENTDTGKRVESLLLKVKKDVEEIADPISWVNSDVAHYNASMEAEARKLLTERKSQAAVFHSMKEILEVPLEKTEYAKHHIPLVQRVLPVKKKTTTSSAGIRMQEPTYILAEADFSYVMDTIRHNCATYERTPATFKSMKEEDMRNILLAALNGSYKGMVAGEAFRKKGKTDICIEYENRAAFVAECKMWEGPAAVSGAVEQLLGYTTWRDCKGTLIIFSRNKDFRRCCEALTETLKNLSKVRSFQSIAPNETCFQIPRADDFQDLVRIHALLVDLSCP